MITLPIIIIVILSLYAIFAVTTVIALRNTHYNLQEILAAGAGFTLAFMFLTIFAMAGH